MVRRTGCCYHAHEWIFPEQVLAKSAIPVGAATLDPSDGGFSGDKRQGMAELQLVAERGHYLAPYARILLAIAYICEKNFTASRRLLIRLRDEFPRRQQGASEEPAQTVPSAAFADPGGGSNNNHNHNDAVAGLSHGEVGTDHLVDGELAALVTTEPNDLVAQIHDRLALILHPRDYDRWLGIDTRGGDPSPPLDLLHPYDADKMVMKPANPAVGNWRNNGPEMLHPP